MTTTATAPAAPAAPVAAAPAIAPAAAPAPAPVIEQTKVAPPSGLQQGDAQKILNSDDSEFGKLFGIDAILAGKPFEQSPASAALETAAAPVDNGASPTEIPTGDDGEVLPAYRSDDKGNLHGPDGKFVPKDAPADPATPATVEEPVADPAADPANPADPAPVVEPVKLATDFTLLDNENQEVEYPAELKVKFTANGKEVELPLDRTIRLAKMGYYNEEKETRFEAIEQRNQQLEPFARELHQEAATLNTHLDRILAGDDEFLARARELYKKETSPEAEVTRLRERVKQLETSPRPADASANAPQQVAATVAPVIIGLIESNKDVVPEAEIWQHLQKLTAPFKDKAGRIAPERLRDVVATVQGALTLTVESLAETRRLAAKTTADAETAKQVARGKVIELKRKVTSAAAPRGQRPAPATDPTPKPAAKANPTAEDTIENALQVGLGRMRAG
jgi:hypothetical protein